mmetsp:Transcript_17784/g.50332  ORF Transcript_17784/g.50332 Transcript_17784/m.50332 type:complete len:261 (-) Transcript_17784:314-1096(-)
MAALAAAFCALPALATALAVQGEARAVLAQAPDTAVKKFGDLSSGIWDKTSLSGPGSRPEACSPFVDFFLGWMRNHTDVESMVEISAGHWPTGWQRFVEWPHIDYTGIDLLEEVITADKEYLAKNGKAGLRSMVFQQGDMLVDKTLPEADLLFTKDTLIHFPNKYINLFISQTVVQCPPKYKYVMFVHDMRERDEENTDINNFGDYHGMQLRNRPFGLNVTTAFTWTAELDGKKRVVQVFDTAAACGSLPAGDAEEEEGF